MDVFQGFLRRSERDDGKSVRAQIGDKNPGPIWTIIKDQNAHGSILFCATWQEAAPAKVLADQLADITAEIGVLGENTLF